MAQDHPRIYLVAVLVFVSCAWGSRWLGMFILQRSGVVTILSLGGRQENRKLVAWYILYQLEQTWNCTLLAILLVIGKGRQLSVVSKGGARHQQCGFSTVPPRWVNHAVFIRL